MAAHTFRAKLFGQEGFTIWNGLWYGGHHTPAYSVLFPPLAWLIGPWLAGALSTISAAAVFDALARERWGERARWGSLWFSAGTGSMLFTGRLPFAMGVAFGLAALLAHQRGRRPLALFLGLCCGLASPVAALFLTLAAVAAFEWEVALGAFLPPALLAAAFPEGGYMPFDVSTYVPVVLLAIVTLVAVPREHRALRRGAVLYALAATVALLVETPMGSNTVRLGALFAGPVFVCVIRPAPRYRVLFGAVLVASAIWQWSSAWRDFVASQNEPSANVAYYDPLLKFLEGENPIRGRVEIPFTRSHWEAAVVAPRFPLARGWERQLDAGRNALFYKGYLSDFTYANWLAEHAVQYVALPDVKPDRSSFKERGLIERGPPYLKLVKRLPHWRIYEVTLPHPMVVNEQGSDIRMTRFASDELEFDVRKPGSAIVRVQWSPYWRARGACVERAGAWTRLIADKPGEVRVTTTFALSRVILRGRRCS